MEPAKHHAVITGGTGSLGRAIAAVMQSPDWTIAAPGTRDLDLRDHVSVTRYFDQRPVDLLVCAAGITRDAPLLRLTEDAWDETWAVNFSGAVSCANAVLPGMIAKEAGHIVFVSSHSALHPPIGQVAYAAAKAALLGLVADLASRYGSSNIRVNAVLPGFLDTRMTKSVTTRRRGEILESHALTRINTCREPAAFIRFLHHELPQTSGQAFQLDSRVKFP